MNVYAMEYDINPVVIYANNENDFAIINNKSAIRIPWEILEEIVQVYNDLRDLKRMQCKSPQRRNRTKEEK